VLRDPRCDLIDSNTAVPVVEFKEAAEACPAMGNVGSTDAARRNNGLRQHGGYDDRQRAVKKFTSVHLIQCRGGRRGGH